MSLDFQQVREQVKELGEKAPQRAQELQSKWELARGLLENNANNLEPLRQKVQGVVKHNDPTLRCAVPVQSNLRLPEALNAHFPTPELNGNATILAADGSQIAPDRHSEVNYCLINVGAIQLRRGSPDPPVTTVSSKLFYDESLYTATGTITEATLALMRDFNERKMLADLSEDLPRPTISFTDGPMELWGAKDSEGASEFQKHLTAYQDVLHRLCRQGVATAGYVDKPAANLVIRLLEVSMIPENELAGIKQRLPLRGVTDFELFKSLLAPGERSAVFEIQSKSAAQYRDEIALHFFYLNVGRDGRPWLARVEIPAWVAAETPMLDNLHAALVEQCRIMGSRPYPYLLHRAHEAAVVTLQEKEQVTQMIALELRQRGVTVGEQSYKQAAKDLSGRTRYSS
jgi:hypothetical protein